MEDGLERGSTALGARIPSAQGVRRALQNQALLRDWLPESRAQVKRICPGLIGRGEHGMSEVTWAQWSIVFQRLRRAYWVSSVSPCERAKGPSFTGNPVK
jgi:hypothetical protein